ncbi:MAG TPA: ABC transporter permease [Candidatus Coproplasma excrementigallinarum]|uniref:ABC transporter permease n=1 Tax=Candidatus Coproplasma excrementigallinarum TaxID=2840747 RepID=A0A9D1MIW6_9FIRM|nr:ABC transporter permease [Candidatus Coproplasma excrementigallinarum]
MSGIIAIIKKEFARFFMDRRMLLTTIIMPGLLIYVVYTIMGSVMGGLIGGDGKSSAVVKNMPSSVAPYFAVAEGLEIGTAVEDDDYYLDRIQDGALDLYVVFPENFDDIIADRNEADYRAPNVDIYYNSAESNSSMAYSLVTGILQMYENQISNVFNVNSDSDVIYDLAVSGNAASYILSAIVPMVLLVMMFSGCMAVAPESIAGEKERGTFATMLVTPVKRSYIAIGKIVSLSCISLLSGLSSFLGLILSLPNLLQGSVDMDLSVFGAGDYIMILGVMLSTVLLIVSLISCISALAKSVKEANSYIGPLNIVVVVVGLLSSLLGGQSSPLLYLIPVYNSALIVTDVMSLSVLPLNFCITIVANIVYACVFGFILTRMFKSERVMFGR